MKFKKIPYEYCSIICDKLTRFKPAKLRYKILFDDIISKFYLDDNILSKDDKTRAQLAIKIINSSFEANSYDETLKNIFRQIEEKYFINDSISDEYLSTTINLTSIIKNSSNLPKNAQWLKFLSEYPDKNIIELREEFELLYPLEGVVLCEGQTEYTLLNTIFNLYGVNLDKIGFLVLPAGGKNQVARKYYELIEYLKLPIYIILDNDAMETKELINTKFRKIDKLYLIKSGEFEDLIPVKILMKAINSTHNNDYICNFDDFSSDLSMVNNLELIYKKYGYGEFKKAQFAKELNFFISENCTKDDFISSEISNITSDLFKN